MLAAGFTWFAGLYGVLAVVGVFAIALIAVRSHELCWRAPSDSKLLDQALREAKGETAAVTALAGALAPAWASQLMYAASSARGNGQPAEVALEETLSELRSRAFGAVLTVHTLGRLAPPIAFVTAMVTLAAAFRHDAGLLSLQRGLAESIAVNHAVLSIMTGTTISFVCRFAVTFLKQRAASLVRELESCADLLTEHDSAQ